MAKKILLITLFSTLSALTPTQSRCGNVVAVVMAVTDNFIAIPIDTQKIEQELKELTIKLKSVRKEKKQHQKELKKIDREIKKLTTKKLTQKI